MNYLALLQLIIGAGLTLYYGAFLLAMCVMLSAYKLFGGKWREFLRLKNKSDLQLLFNILFALAMVMIGVIGIHDGYHNVWQN